jgi:hypothetical protein
MAKTAKTAKNSGKGIDARVKLVAKASKKGQQCPSHQLRPAAEFRPGLPLELYLDQDEEGPGPEYYND